MNGGVPLVSTWALVFIAGWLSAWAVFPTVKNAPRARLGLCAVLALAGATVIALLA